MRKLWLWFCCSLYALFLRYNKDPRFDKTPDVTDHEAAGTKDIFPEVGDKSDIKNDDDDYDKNLLKEEQVGHRNMGRLVIGGSKLEN